VVHRDKLSVGSFLKKSIAISFDLMSPTHNAPTKREGEFMAVSTVGTS
jgi:hypothetical protein